MTALSQRRGGSMAALLTCLLLAPAPAAEPPEAVKMVIDLVRRDDPGFRGIGLDRIRHGLRGEAATVEVASLLATAPPARQIELIGALADRGDNAAVPAVAAILNASQDAAVRSEALQALGAIGGATEVAVLTRSLAAADPEKTAALRALVDIRGVDVGRQLVAAATSGDPAVRVTCIEILAERRERAAVPDLIGIACDADNAARAAALRGLARFGGPTDVEGLVRALLKSPPGVVRDEATKAVVAVCTATIGNAEAAKTFLARFQAAGDADRELLLPALSRIGGPGALDVVDGLIAAADPARRKLGLLALSRWPDATVAPRLLDLIAKTQDPEERDLLLGALIRIAPLPDNKLDDSKKLGLLQKAMTLCQKPEDRARVLERANAIRTVETFRFVLPYLDDPQLAEPACLSIVELAHHQNLRDAHKPEFAKALDKVIATTKNPELVERANRYKEGKTWERAKKG
jgi:HEAT repeat protein